jgi:hypothetical protein
MALPSAKGTETVLLGRKILTVRQTISTLGGAEDSLDWIFYGTSMKPLIIAAGTSNGLAIKHASASATPATVTVEIGFVETSFV